VYSLIQVCTYEVKEVLHNPVNGYWRIVVQVHNRPRPYLDHCVKSLQLQEKVGNAFPLAVDGAVGAMEIQA